MPDDPADNLIDVFNDTREAIADLNVEDPDLAGLKIDLFNGLREDIADAVADPDTDPAVFAKLQTKVERLRDATTKETLEAISSEPTAPAEVAPPILSPYAYETSKAKGTAGMTVLRRGSMYFSYEYTQQFLASIYVHTQARQQELITEQLGFLEVSSGGYTHTYLMRILGILDQAIDKLVTSFNSGKCDFSIYAQIDEVSGLFEQPLAAKSLEYTPDEEKAFGEKFAEVEKKAIEAGPMTRRRLKEMIKRTVSAIRQVFESKKFEGAQKAEVDAMITQVEWIQNFVYPGTLDWLRQDLNSLAPGAGVEQRIKSLQKAIRRAVKGATKKQAAERQALEKFAGEFRAVMISIGQKEALTRLIGGLRAKSSVDLETPAKAEPPESIKGYLDDLKGLLYAAETFQGISEELRLLRDAGVEYSAYYEEYNNCLSAWDDAAGKLDEGSYKQIRLLGWKVWYLDWKTWAFATAKVEGWKGIAEPIRARRLQLYARLSTVLAPLKEVSWESASACISSLIAQMRDAAPSISEERRKVVTDRLAKLEEYHNSLQERYQQLPTARKAITDSLASINKHLKETASYLMDCLSREADKAHFRKVIGPMFTVFDSILTYLITRGEPAEEAKPPEGPPPLKPAEALAPEAKGTARKPGAPAPKPTSPAEAAKKQPELYDYFELTLSLDPRTDAQLVQIKVKDEYAGRAVINIVEFEESHGCEFLNKSGGTCIATPTRLEWRNPVSLATLKLDTQKIDYGRKVKATVKIKVTFTTKKKVGARGKARESVLSLDFKKPR